MNNNEHEEHEFYEDARNRLLPMLKESYMTISIAPGDDPDVKVAMEMGLSLWLDKPILVVLPTGRSLPEKVRLIADEVVEGDMMDPKTQADLVAAIERMKS